MRAAEAMGRVLAVVILAGLIGVAALGLAWTIEQLWRAVAG